MPLPVFHLGEGEWLAVLPAAPEWTPDLPSSAPPPDPAAAVRGAHPLALDAFLAALRPGAGALAFSVRLQIALEPLSKRPLARAAVPWLGCVGMAAAFGVYAGGYYGTAQLATGMATFLAFATCSTVLVSAFSAYRVTFNTVSSGNDSKAAAEPKPARDFSSYGAAGLARWMQLVSGALPGGAGGLLLLHDPKDPLCPCGVTSCAGRIPLLAGVTRIAESAFKFCIFSAYIFVLFASIALFPPMAPEMWAVPWAVFLFVIFLAGALGFLIPVVFSRLTTNLPLLQLARRINRRAMRLALDPVVESYRSAAAASGPWTGPDKPQRAAYMDLHRIFASSWGSRIRTYNVSSPILIPIAAAIVAGCANMAAGSCLPAVYPVYLAYQLCALFLFDLINVAAANAQISDIRSLYLDAAQELADVRRELLSCPSRPPDPALAAAIESDVQVLAGYMDMDRYRARFLGFVVTFGALRTLLATALTLVVGLWSVLRGLGVELTGQLACPPRL